MAITERYASEAGAGAHDGSSEANAFSWAEMYTDINVGGRAGNRFNYKQGAGLARTTTTDTLTGDGTVTAPVIIRGYKTVPGDGFLGRSSGNGALISTNMPVVTYTTGRIAASGANFILYESLNISSAASNPTLFTGSDSAIRNCILSNSSTNGSAQALNAGARNVVFDNDISLTAASGGQFAVSNGADTRIICNRIKGGPAVGINWATNAHHVIIGNLIYASAGKHISSSGASITARVTIFGNTLVGGSSDAWDIITGSTPLHCLINNMITDNGGYGTNPATIDIAIFAANNRTRDNTLGADNLALDWLAATKYNHIVTDTGGPETDYVNSAGGDYSLIASSPAKGAAWFPYGDIGAMQRQESGGAAHNYGIRTGGRL